MRGWHIKCTIHNDISMQYIIFNSDSINIIIKGDHRRDIVHSKLIVVATTPLSTSHSLSTKAIMLMKSWITILTKPSVVPPPLAFHHSFSQSRIIPVDPNELAYNNSDKMWFGVGLYMTHAIVYSSIEPQDSPQILWFLMM